MKYGLKSGWPLALATLLFMAAPAAAQNAGYFKLQTMFQEPENKCFEGNRFAPDAVLQGGAFMDDCQNVSGQSWTAVPEGNGYFRLKTEFQGALKCLRAMVGPRRCCRVPPSWTTARTYQGSCGGLFPIAMHFWLKTQLRGDSKVSRGQHPPDDAAGAAFMDTCQKVSGSGRWPGAIVNGIPQPTGQAVVQPPVVVQQPGQVVVQPPVVVQQPGQPVTNLPAGQPVVQQPGQSVINLPAGQYVIHLPAGQYVIQQPTGQVVVQQPAGQILVQQPVGQNVVPQSVVVAAQPAGQCRLYEHINYGGKEWVLQANNRVHWYDEAQQRVNFRSRADRASARFRQ